MVNSSDASVLRSRRGLYEALLRLEREGAVVVERDMPAADLALSASTCLNIWPESSLQVCQEIFLGYLHKASLQVGAPNMLLALFTWVLMKALWTCTRAMHWFS